MEITRVGQNYNIGIILDDILKKSKNKNYMVFIDFDGVIVSETHSYVRFRNSDDYILDCFKEVNEDKNCRGLYILTYRGNTNDALSRVVDEVNELGLADIFISSDDKYFNDVSLNECVKNSRIISADCCTEKITIIDKLLRSIKYDVRNIIDTVYFIDNSVRNIIMSVANKNRLLNSINYKLIYFPNRNAELININVEF